MALNLLESANKRKFEEAQKAEQEKRIAAQIRQERLTIRLSIFQIVKDPVKSAQAWKIIKDIKFPDITVYANALYVCLNNGEMSDMKQLDIIVDYLRED